MGHGPSVYILYPKNISMCIVVSALIIYKERARFARSLLAPISKHIAYFTQINLIAYIASWQIM